MADVGILALPGPWPEGVAAPGRRPLNVMLGLDPSICHGTKSTNIEPTNGVWAASDPPVEPEHYGITWLVAKLKTAGS
jgi:hypothetical protein